MKTEIAAKIRRVIYRLTRCARWLFDSKNAKTRKHAIRVLFVSLVSVITFVSGHLYEVFKQESVSQPINWLKQKILHADQVLTGISLMGMFLFVLLLFMGFWMIYEAWRKTQPVKNLGSPIFSKPDFEAEEFLQQSREAKAEYRITGSSIEIARHPDIFPDLTISGWDCLKKLQVKVIHDFGLNYSQFDKDLINNKPIPDGANGNKFSLISSPVDYLDASSLLVLRVHKTDYYTVKRFNELIQNKETRFKLSSIQPEEHRIPHSLCLHYLVQLSDGHIICLRRKANVDYAAEKISITGEEQLSSDDMENVDPLHSMGHWFRRALCEEIFPLRATNKNQLEKNWQKIHPFVEALRVLSVFYEEKYANFSLFGFTRLSLDLEEYKEHFQKLAGNSLTGRDKEGQIFVLNKEEARKLITEGIATVQSLWGGGEHQQISDKHMHSSSRYRLLFFLQAVGEIER